jgi:integrase
MQSNHLESSSKAFHYAGENLQRRSTSGVYYALLKRGRKQFRRSLKTTDRALAKQRLNALRQDVAHLSTQESSAINFDALAERWLGTVAHTMKESTVLRRQMSFKALSPFFRGMTVRNITAHHCEAWVTTRGDKIAPATFAHELGVMRAVFKFAVSQGLILHDPAKHIKRKRILQPKIEVPSREEFQNLIAAIRLSDGRCSSQAKAKDGADLVELLAYSGCRLDEARNLKWADVDFGREVFTITGGEKRTKNYESRTVPISTALRDLLSRLQSETKSAPGDLIVKIQSAKKCLETACRKLNLPKFTHHDFRHLFATSCIESGVDIPTVSRWLGHKDGGALAMKTYGHLRQDHSFAQMKRVTFGVEQAANVVKLNQVVSA